MVSKKSSRGISSKVSSSAAPTASSMTHVATKSSILRSLFPDPQLHQSLFASVIQGLESQHLRIHDTATGRLRCEHAISARATINCLDWGYYGRSGSGRRHQETGSKRKRDAPADGHEAGEMGREVALAFGTSDSEIKMYSPTQAKIVGMLEGGHTQGIKDFKFSTGGKRTEGWSIGGDGKLTQWDLRKRTSIR